MISGIMLGLAFGSLSASACMKDWPYDRGYRLLMAALILAGYLTSLFGAP